MSLFIFFFFSKISLSRKIRLKRNFFEYFNRYLRTIVYRFLSGKPLKFVDKFAFIGSNISSTESDVSIRLAKRIEEKLDYN